MKLTPNDSPFDKSYTKGTQLSLRFRLWTVWVLKLSVVLRFGVIESAVVLETSNVVKSLSP